MIRLKRSLMSVTIAAYNGVATPALFLCRSMVVLGNGHKSCIVRRCYLVDDSGGQEINARIAELGRLVEGDKT